MGGSGTDKFELAWVWVSVLIARKVHAYTFHIGYACRREKAGGGKARQGKARMISKSCDDRRRKGNIVSPCKPAAGIRRMTLSFLDRQESEESNIDHK